MLFIPYYFFLQRFLSFPADLILILLAFVPIYAPRVLDARKKTIPKAKLVLVSVVFGLILAGAVVVPMVVFETLHPSYYAEGVDLSYAMFMAPLIASMVGIHVWFAWRYRLHAALETKSIGTDEKTSLGEENVRPAGM